MSLNLNQIFQVFQGVIQQLVQLVPVLVQLAIVVAILGLIVRALAPKKAVEKVEKKG